MNREIWLDYLRAFACMLVAVGHLLMSLDEIGIIGECTLVSFFIQMIYHFHVYIFFFCSGYLFQKKYKKMDVKLFFWKKFIHCIDLIIPYVFFSTITFFIKVVLSNDVNSPVKTSLIEVLLMEPINQMWYLYALVLIVFLMPLINSKNMLYLLVFISIGAKVLVSLQGDYLSVPIKYFCSNVIWFVLGMYWEYGKVKTKKGFIALCGASFIVLNLYEYIYGIHKQGLDIVLTFVGVIASIGICYLLTYKKKNMSFVWMLLSKYMFQIYLLHTICAAGVRIILIKLGCINFWIHFVIGIVFSFIVPVVCAMIVEKISILNIVFFPSKTFCVMRNKLGLHAK